MLIAELGWCASVGRSELRGIVWRPDHGTRHATARRRVDVVPTPRTHRRRESTGTNGPALGERVMVEVGPDTLAAEEPLEIRVGRRCGAPPLAVTMRTPGDDLDLAIGFLLTEGIIRRRDDVAPPSCAPATTTPNTYNVVDVALRRRRAGAGDRPGPQLLHHLLVRGLRQGEHRRGPDPVALRRRRRRRPGRAGGAGRAARRAARGAAGLRPTGRPARGGRCSPPTASWSCLREDVGRHNAVDKVVGWAVRQGRLPLAGHVLMVSGRASFELCQKAWMAGIPVLAAVSAPSTLAVDLADGGRPDPRRLPARPDLQRLRRRAPRRRAGAGRRSRRTIGGSDCGDRPRSRISAMSLAAL